MYVLQHKQAKKIGIGGASALLWKRKWRMSYGGGIVANKFAVPIKMEADCFQVSLF